MANEITVTSQVKVSNGLLIYTGPSTSKTITQTTARGGSFTQDIGTSEETIDFGDMAPGVCQLRNLDATNFVEIGGSTGVYLAILPANGTCPFLFYRKAGATIYCKSDTGACKIQIEAINA